MAGFFQRLAARTLGAGTPVAQPVVPSVFASGGTLEPTVALSSEPPWGARTNSQHVVADADRPSRETPAPLVTPVPGAVAREAVRHDFDEPALAAHAPDSPMAPPLVQPLLVPVAAAASSAVVLKGESHFAMPEAGPASGSQRDASPARALHAAEQSAPSIRVTIGRVEVRAEFPSGAPARPARGSSSPALSLEQYQRQRDGGLR